MSLSEDTGNAGKDMEAANGAATLAGASVREAELTFGHDQAAIRLPPGTYQGTVTPGAHYLGANGAGLNWLYVTITYVPNGAEEWLGRQVNVRLLRSAPAN